MRELLRRKAAAKPLWAPLPGPQTSALKSRADVIGYGGQAGGGKTDVLVGTAVSAHHKAIIFRREYPQLKDIVKRAKEVTEGVRVGFNGSDNTLSLPDGQTVEFGAMQHPDDWEKYKGRAHDLKAYDEATEFLESQVRSSMAWCRSSRPGQRCRVLLTFNPPSNSAGKWVTRFFAPWLDRKHPNPAAPGELRWFATVAGEEVERPDGEPFTHPDETGPIYPLSRTFIPAKLSDNPYLDGSPEYRRVLQSTPEPLRSQLLYGSFDAGVEEDPWQVLPTKWVEAAMARWPSRRPEVRMTVMGVDVAHGGKDKTVLAPRYGDYVGELRKYPGSATPDGRSAAAFAFDLYEPGAAVNVDAIGYGASCQERLADMTYEPSRAAKPAPPGSLLSPAPVRPPARPHKVNARAVNVGEKSHFRDRSGKYRMVNQRAEMYWRLREALDPEYGSTFALPPDRELLADLTAPTYEITPQGVKIEPKDEIKLRLSGRSPDCGDAVCLSMLGDETYTFL